MVVAWEEKGVFLTSILGRMGRDRQRRARRARLAAVRSGYIVQMFGVAGVALWSGAMRAGVSPAEGLGPLLGRPSLSAPPGYSAALPALAYQRQRPNRSDEPATISRPGLLLVDLAPRLGIN